ncbi:cytochrome ubiquinol oxidase subunit I [Microlunatus elymi]|uniref:Cytochrome ubiquinol oxidase subunit I n=2 Tax=Microlunatus elymi TaxID=2596828 RepID=A0A516Q605_9ACTN|nr:cytochrome ubiquinol oxidase subunit I [Microlunatus elymi]
MAFTLMCHIILVPLGVSWALMTLVANYRAIRHDNPHALLLAQRWSKYMAVTFAVGAVTGTVLSFEFGLLWPRFMGRWGAAFGVPFAFEGIFFFVEAIFVAIYIFGWRRLKPWTHFWTGVPIVLAGIFGTMSVVAANAWMNAPAGFTLNAQGDVVSVNPIGVIFNKSMPLQAAHMLVAAYLVGGFLVASVYAAAMLRGRRDHYHRLAFTIAFTVAAIATPVQLAVGDTIARWVYQNQPTKFAAIELVPTTSSDVPETLLGRVGPNWTVKGGLPIPGLASWLSDPSTGKATVVQGLKAFPVDNQPTIAEVNIVHLMWDVMIGLGTLLFLLALWYGIGWVVRRRLPSNRLFLLAATAAGPLAVIAMEAGWIVTEVGRQPWIVYNQMRVSAAVTGNHGVWISFIAIVILYAALGVTTILVLHRMSRRFRRAGGFVEHDTPYAPRPAPQSTPPAEPEQRVKVLDP